MVAKSKEDFTYLEIYRPVLEGMEKFADKARFHGREIFGTRLSTAVTQPDLAENPDGALEPMWSTKGLESPRLTVYGADHLGLPLVERRAIPRMKYGAMFSHATRRLIRNSAEIDYEAIPHSDDDINPHLEQPRRTSLASVFRRIGLEYGIKDQQHLEVPLYAVDIPVDPPLEHLGLEVQLVPDPKSKVTQMLVRQAGVCIRGLSNHSKKVTNPWTPSSLRIPFARMPHDATPKEVTDFIMAMEGHLAIRVMLGGFKDRVGGASWEPKDSSS